MKNIYIKSYYGFGDNIFLFPFVKEACKKYKKVYIQTFFPFIFESLPNVKFVKPEGARTLRTCQDSYHSYPNDYWSKLPNNIHQIKIPYYLTQFKVGQNLIQSFNEGIPIKSQKIDPTLYVNPEWLKAGRKILREINTTKKICLIKAPSDRKDWRNAARVPKIEYFQHLIDKYKDEYYFISIGNKNIEITPKPLENIDKRYEYGELDLRTIIGLASLSDMIIAYNCFFFPLGMAVKTKTFVINGGYSNPEMYIDRTRTDLPHVSIINPDPVCICLDRKHNCYKEIDLEVLDKKFKALKNDLSYVPKVRRKRNLLISRMRANRCVKIAENELISNNFNIFTIDHTSVRNYQVHKLFRESYQFPSVGDICLPQVDNKKAIELHNYCKKILQSNHIEFVINSQPLHPYHTAMKNACKELNIPVINTETAFDDKWLFDWKGCQYTNGNEIYDYVNKISLTSDKAIDYPKTSRQDQPSTISKEKFFEKYKLDPNGEYIVFLGQLAWDMSIKQSVNSNTKTYKDYINLILKSNPKTTFIFKHHPLYNRSSRKNEIEFVKDYPNVVLVDESLETLFNIFDYFTSFSSTTIIEGLLRNKKFATMGFHYCNNDDLVLQLRIDDRATDLYKRLKEFKINQETKMRYLRFIFNYYTVDLSSKKLAYRLLLPSQEYFKLEL